MDILCVVRGEQSGVVKNVPWGTDTGNLLGNIIKRTNIYKKKLGFYSIVDRRKRITDEDLSRLRSVIKKSKPDLVVFFGSNLFKEVCRDEEPSEGYFRTIKLAGKTRRAFVVMNHIRAFANVAAISEMEIHLLKAFSPKPEDFRIHPGTYELLDTYKKVKRFITDLIETERKIVALDIESDNLNKKYGNKILTLQFAVDGKKGYVIPWAHKESPWEVDEQKKIKKLFKKLFTGPVNFKYWLTHNGKFEVTVIYSFLGCYINNAFILDTRTAGWQLNENRLRTEGFSYPYALETYFKEYGYSKYTDLEDVEEARSDGELAQLPLSELAEYGAKDVYALLQLWVIFSKIAKLQGYYKDWLNQQKYYFSPCLKFFSIMEVNGAKVDRDYIEFLKTKDGPIIRRMDEIEEHFKINKNIKEANDILLEDQGVANMNVLFGGKPWVFDINSEDSQRVLFWEVLDLEPLEFGKFKQGNDKECKHPSQSDYGYYLECDTCGAVSYASLGKNFKDAYKESCLEVALFAEYVQLKKLASAYINQIDGYINPECGSIDNYKDCRLRANNNIAGTVTSRTSTTSPNTSQIPKASDIPCPKCEGKGVGKNKKKCKKCLGTGSVPSPKKQIKNMYIAPKGKKLVQADGATAEVRVWGLLSKDKNLSALYRKAAKVHKKFLANPDNKKLRKEAELSADVHKQTASLMYGLKVEDVQPDMRQNAKGLTFGTIYGMGIATLAGNLGITNKEAEKLQRAFFKPFPGAEKWLKDMINTARKNGFIQSPLGTRRRLCAYYLDGSKRHRGEVAKAERQTGNSIIQGFSAQLIMLGGALLNNYIMKHNLRKKWGWKLVNFIHDALVYEVNDDKLRESLDIIDEVMTKVLEKYVTKYFNFEFSLPLKIDMEFDERLGELKKWDCTDDGFDKVLMLIEKGRRHGKY